MLPMNVLKFANGNEDVKKVYEQMSDYYNHYTFANTGKRIGEFDDTVALSEKEDKMNKALLAEVSRVSGASIPEGISFEMWAMNPQVKWATFAVVGMMIDAVIPDTIIKDLGVFCDMHQVGFGETLEMEVEPNGLFVVSESADANRTAFNRKQYNATYSLTAVNHEITVEVALFRVLAGKESLAKFVAKAVASIERKMTHDCYDAFASLVNNASFPSALKKTGYSVDNLLTLAQTVEAYAGKPVIVGTKKTVRNIMPNASEGYRIVTDASDIKIGLIKNFLDYDIMFLDQVATGSNYGLKLDDNKLYVMAMGGDRPIKGNLKVA